MDLLISLRCSDHSSYCLSPRGTAILISIISLAGCLFDVLYKESSLESCSSGRQHVKSLKNVSLKLFQMANMLLLLGSVVENELLLKIYLWYMLSFVLIQLVVSILDLCFRVIDEGIWSLKAFATFVSEVTFLFATFRCLPFVDNYKKGLEGI